MNEWITKTKDNFKLYSTKKSESFEFVISDRFVNPKFMIFPNSIRHNGTIVGLIFQAEQISGTRWKVVAKVRTSNTFTRYYSASGGQSFIIGNMFYARRIEIAGFLYPIGSVGAMNGTVKIEVLEPNTSGVIATFNNVNRVGSSYMGSYWWSYLIPSAYYNSGVGLRYSLTHDRGSAAVDMFAVLTTQDVVYADDGSGNMIATGWDIADIMDGSFTILVCEGGV